jgi:hypothetical protein
MLEKETTNRGGVDRRSFLKTATCFGQRCGSYHPHAPCRPRKWNDHGLRGSLYRSR